MPQASVLSFPDKAVLLKIKSIKNADAPVIPGVSALFFGEAALPYL